MCGPAPPPHLAPRSAIRRARLAACGFMRLTPPASSDAPAASSGALVRQDRVQLLEAHASRRRAARGAGRAAARSRASLACRRGASPELVVRRLLRSRRRGVLLLFGLGMGAALPPGMRHVSAGAVRAPGPLCSGASRTQPVLRCVTCGAEAQSERLPNLTKLHVHPCHYGAVVHPAFHERAQGVGDATRSSKEL